MSSWKGCLKLLIILGALVASYTPAAQGKMEGHLSYFAWGYKTEGNNLGSTESYLSDYQIKLGYNGGSYFLGLVYDQFFNELGNSKPRVSYGLSVGYRANNWFFDFNYFAGSVYELSSVTKLQAGSGFGLDVGYRWFVSSTFFAGVQFSYRTLSYGEVSINENATTGTNKISQEYHPGLLFGLFL